MWIERITTLVTLVASLAGGFVYMNEHYASAADLNKLAKDFRLQTYDLRKRQLKDRIFELEFKQNSKKLTDLEKAQLNGAKQELQEITTNEAAINRPTGN
jgi:hypothetical protein